MSVLYAGEDDASHVLDPEFVQAGCLLRHRHPGVIRAIYGPGVNHCIVQFIGLEDEPISTMFGFDHLEDGRYPGLLAPTEAEWERALGSGWWSISRCP
ncbi:hypothetical protein [Ornithinimicrobium murale]|uniref:hypothetical protein n=1 Tax=Ornithinimicrobium murale TaxID=1050153 RepID=UPI0013B380DC|nr:hypothetical protein [Ornithinimicrobium murale]